MPTREKAIEMLQARGHNRVADDLRRWRNVLGNAGGWDAYFKSTYPELEALVWPTGKVGPTPRAPAKTATRTQAQQANQPGKAMAGDTIPLVAPKAPNFDAYLMVDWSAHSEPKRGKDSIWWSILRWEKEGARIEFGNCATRSEFEHLAKEKLAGALASLRVLVGFDFPLGFPKGFARAVSPETRPAERWSRVWNELSLRIRDADDNANNRFVVAAELNRRTSGRAGPFFGHPPKVNLDGLRASGLTFPFELTTGEHVARMRATDIAASAGSSPWFLYGGSNSVGSQALLGIPRVARLRKHFADSRVWPFETGAAIPSRKEARIVFAEIYPSIFHKRDRGATQAHDEMQVLATAKALARHDAAGNLGRLFEGYERHPAPVQEEGWILGVVAQ